MLQQQAFGSSGGKTQSAIEQDPLVTFDPTEAVRAIVFHLIDEKLARSVAPDSIRRTVDRLKARSFHAYITKLKWNKLTNPQRLDWLLAESLTLTVMAEGDCATLRARRNG
jgi:hypothetical protein